MRGNITVNKAISKGKWTINFPSILLLFGFFTTGIFLFTEKYFEGWIILIGTVLGFVTAWIYWSYAIVKWRIWAYENVRNVHELKRKAIQHKLIWEDGSWATKTEIKSYDQKEKLKRLEKKFLEKDVYHDDINVVKETRIGYSKVSLLIGLIIGFGIIIFTIYAFYKQDEKYYILLFSLLGVYLIYISIKKYSVSEPQLIINSFGIKLFKKDFMEWENITDDFVVIRQNGKHVSYHLVFQYHNLHQEISINELDTNIDKLENLLQVYRVRFEKNNQV